MKKYLVKTDIGTFKNVNAKNAKDAKAMLLRDYICKVEKVTEQSHMNKKEYFKLIREIMDNVRGNGFRYARIFSEPRKRTNGYRTKIWRASRDLVGAQKLVEFINGLNFSVDVKIHDNLGGGTYCYYRDVVITPKVQINDK